MAADHHSTKQNDAVVLLTGTHVDELIAALRGVNTVVVRLEGAVRDLIKSNRELKHELHKQGPRRKAPAK